MARIFQIKNIWYTDITVDGRRLRKRVGKSKRLAETRLKELEVARERKQLKFDIPDIEIDDLFLRYINHSKVHHRPKTTLRYQQSLHNFQIFLAMKCPHIRKVGQLKLTVFDSFKAWRRTVDPRSVKLPEGCPLEIKRGTRKGRIRTVNYEVKVLRAAFNFGLKRDLLRHNPAAGVELIKVAKRIEPRFLTAEEVQLFLDHAEDEYRPIFEFLLYTGLRLGEVLNLQWKDIDIKHRTLKVRAKDDWQPKSGDRTVSMPCRAAEILKGLDNSKHRPATYVFHRKNGKKYTPKVRGALIRAAKKAGIKDLTKVHTLRHTYASHLIMGGADIATVQRLLGHSDIQTTMIYSHLAADHIQETVEKLSYATNSSKH